VMMITFPSSLPMGSSSLRIACLDACYAPGAVGAPGAPGFFGAIGAFEVAAAEVAGGVSRAAAISASVAPHLMHFVASGLLIFPHTGHLIGWLRFAAPGLKHISILSPRTGACLSHAPALVLLEGYIAQTDVFLFGAHVDRLGLPLIGDGQDEIGFGKVLQPEVTVVVGDGGELTL